MNKGVVQEKKTNDGRTTWIVQGNKKLSFKKSKSVVRTKLKKESFVF